jgi:ParB family chromosome partitioning protein
MTTVKKVKVDPRKALEQHQAASTAAAVDRFAAAQAITSDQPHGLAPMSMDKSAPAADQAEKSTKDFDPAASQVGSIVRVPLHLLDVNPFSPRQFYKNEEIDKIASSLPEGQHDAAHGYVDQGRVKLIDGGTRYRAAKVSDTQFLEVKIEETPQNDLDRYLRARAYNDQRSQPTPVDHALSLIRLLDSGAVASQVELSQKVPDLSGRPMSEAQVSMYMRIGRMPEKILRSMNEEPETSSTRTLYEVSAIFDKIDPDRLDERIELALEVIEEIKRRKLNKYQVQELVKSRLHGPKQRERSTMHHFHYAGGKGQIKIFAKKGQLDMTMKGLQEEEMNSLKQQIASLVESFMASRKAGPDRG